MMLHKKAGNTHFIRDKKKRKHKHYEKKEDEDCSVYTPERYTKSIALPTT